MAAKRQTTWISTFIIWVIAIALIFTLGRKVINFLAPKSIDVTPMVNRDKEDLETILKISMTENPDIAKKITHYSTGEITVDSADGIGVIYIDGKRSGLYINNTNYSMYGLRMGDAQISIEKRMTYEYDRSYIVPQDDLKSEFTALFYSNSKKGDGLVVIYNDHIGRVVSMIYYSDMKRATERLSFSK